MVNDFEHLATALMDRYRLDRVLGRGGMATVYLAEDLRHRRRVAIKVLHPELAASVGVERFLREIAIAAQLTHPHILPLFDSGEANGSLYYVMPYVEGESLRDRLNRERQLPLTDAVQVAREVADGLGYAHSLGLVHRDIKPENILLSGGHAVITDFGIARAISAAGSEKLTATGLAVGTPAYMSPEQAEGAATLDGRSDVYSLGCLLYEMLGGEPPFTGSTAQAILARKASQPAPPLRALRDTVPDDVERTVLASLARAPADRFPTAAAFAEALEHHGGPIVAGRPRHRAMRWAVAVAIPALGLAWWWSTREPAPAMENRVAVLPFENLSGDSAQNYFVDGLHEELITELAQVSALSVISRPAVLPYRGARTSLAAVARELDVAWLLTGSVLRSGDSVRLHARLVQPAPERVRWAQAFDAALRDIRDVQRAVALAIAERVRVPVSGPERARLTRSQPVDPVAYEAYLRGLHFANQFTPSGFERSIEEFGRALAIDSSMAPAFAGLGYSYGLLVTFGVLPPDEGFPKAEHFARQALTLDASLAEAHNVLAWALSFYRWNWDAADQAFRRAIELNPSFAHFFYAVHLAATGRRSDAIVEIARVHRLAPGFNMIGTDVGWMYYFDRQFARAISELEEARVLYPRFWDVYHHLGMAYLADRQMDEAIASLETSVRLEPNPITRAMLGHAYGRATRRSDARRIVRELEAEARQGFRQPFLIGMVHYGLGDTLRAIEWFEQSVAQRDWWVPIMNVEPALDQLRSHPRFQALLRRVAFPN